MTSDNRLRVAVFGVGAVGGYFGGRLADAGHDVTFIARGETLAALRSSGLRVDSVNGDFVVHPARTAEEPAAVGPVDLVLLGVKAWQVEPVAPALAPLLADGSAVLPLQNGVEAVAQIGRAVGPQHALGGLCKIICFRIAPGHLRHAGAEPTVAVGEIDRADSARVQRIRDAFTDAGVTVESAPDIHAAIWSKFLFITAVSGLGAATRVTLGELRDDGRTRRLLESAMHEVATLAARRDVELAPDVVERTMQFVDALPAEGTASMQRDIMDGVPSELDAQTGAVVRLAREVDLQLPVNEMLYTLLRPLERRARGG